MKIACKPKERKKGRDGGREGRKEKKPCTAPQVLDTRVYNLENLPKASVCEAGTWTRLDKRAWLW